MSNVILPRYPIGTKVQLTPNARVNYQYAYPEQVSAPLPLTVIRHKLKEGCNRYNVIVKDAKGNCFGRWWSEIWFEPYV